MIPLASAFVPTHGAAPMSSFCRKASLAPPTSSALRISREPHTISMLSPSGIDGLPILQQQLVFAGVFVGLGIGTAVAQKSFDALEKALPAGWWQNWVKTWPLLGAIYILAGYAHFGAQGAFLSIYPPKGTWGMWALPGSPEFHVAWTGVAEFLGGLGLLVGGAVDALGPKDMRASGRKLSVLAAACLALLTAAVTPANIYMYTHGAIMVGAGPDGPVPVAFHYGRFVAQIFILSILTGLARRGDVDAVEK